MLCFKRPTPPTSSAKPESRTTAPFRNTMCKATMKPLFQRKSSCRCRKNWYAGEWCTPAPTDASAATAVTIAFPNSSSVANATKCSGASTGTTEAANPSSGVVKAACRTLALPAESKRSMRSFCRTSS